MGITLQQVFKVINVIAYSILATVWFWRIIYYIAYIFYFWDLLNPLVLIAFCVILIINECEEKLFQSYLSVLNNHLARGILYFYFGSATMFGFFGLSTAMATICRIYGVLLWLLGIFFIIFYFAGDKVGGSKNKVEQASDLESEKKINQQQEISKS